MDADTRQNQRSKSEKDVIVVIGPSGSGKRTVIGVLEDRFNYCAVTKVTLDQLLPLVEVVPAENLVFPLLLSRHATKALTDGYPTLLDEYARCFQELQRKCRRLRILFLYCLQDELATRQTVGFHPFVRVRDCGTLKAAIFKECEMVVQLFCHLAHPTLGLETNVAFLDTSGFPVTDLRTVIEEQITSMSEATPLVPPRQFISRGWNEMRKTLHEVQRQRLKFVDELAPNKRVHKLGRLNCLILGETGVGKELIAEYLAGGLGPMVRLNCEGMPRDLLESELWGHVKGAYTGATGDRAGQVSQADNGTLFVDEIGFADPVVQQKLLRFIETREYRKLGSNEVERVNCRIIAATSRDLEEDARNRTFLPDLYYRIAGVTITVPPLRRRREDIPLLVNRLLDGDGCAFSPEAMAILFDQPWDGNVRMLKDVVEHCRKSTGTIQASELPTRITRPYSGLRDYHERKTARSSYTRPKGGPTATYDELFTKELLTGQHAARYEHAMRSILHDALVENDWNVARVARQLHMHRSTVYREMKKFKIAQP